MNHTMGAIVGYFGSFLYYHGRRDRFSDGRTLEGRVLSELADQCRTAQQMAVLFRDTGAAPGPDAPRTLLRLVDLSYDIVALLRLVTAERHVPDLRARQRWWTEVQVLAGEARELTEAIAAIPTPTDLTSVEGTLVPSV